MGPEGMVVRWEVDSKTLQSFVFMKPAVCHSSDIFTVQTCAMGSAATQLIRAFSLQLFSQYHSPGTRKSFGLQFSNLTDTLHVFASSGHELELRYPGPNMELECR